MSTGVWEGIDPVAFLRARVSWKQGEAGAKGCGCLRSDPGAGREEADLESVCQSPVSRRDGSLLVRSAGRKLVKSRFAGTWGSEKGQIQCSLGKAAYAGGTGESVASSSFSVIIPLFRARRAVLLLPRSLLDLPAAASTVLVAVGPCLSTQLFPGHRHPAGQGGARLLPKFFHALVAIWSVVACLVFSNGS